MRLRFFPTIYTYVRCPIMYGSQYQENANNMKIQRDHYDGASKQHFFIPVKFGPKKNSQHSPQGTKERSRRTQQTQNLDWINICKTSMVLEN